MGFYARKNVNVGPFQFNFSNSAVGTSAGDKKPTTWSLIDRRSKARVTTAVALAPAISNPGATVLLGVENSGMAASVGRFVRSRASCPASGWWHCQDSAALDGPRRFAHGDVLPTATFHIAQKKLLFASQNVTVFQRRSTWKLVR